MPEPISHICLSSCLLLVGIVAVIILAQAPGAADDDTREWKRPTRTAIEFIDTRAVEHTYLLERRVTPVTKHPANPILDDCHSPQTVLRGDDGRLRMWYATRRRIPGHTGSAREYTLRYAESDDGVEWSLPNLGLKEFDGSTGNNVLITANDTDAAGRELTGVRGMENFCIIDRERSPAPHTRGRYTALLEDGSFAHSDDGLGWTAYPENPTFDPRGSDTYNNFLFDTGIGRYVLYHRPHPNIHAGHPRANRLVARIESDDLLNWDWSTARCVLDTDGRDAPAYSDKENARGRDMQFYGMMVTQYQDFYLGFAHLLNEKTGSLETYLLHSFDAIDWRREADDEPFIPATPGAWDSGCISTPPRGCPILMGDDLCFYYGAMNMSHNYKMMNDEPELRMRLGLGMVKKGRLVGYHAGEAEGQLLTRPFILKGPMLLNTDAEGGEVRCALADGEGTPIPGFSLDEAVPITNNGIAQPMQWNGSSNLGEVVGKPVRVRLAATNAAIYGLGWR